MPRQARRTSSNTYRFFVPPEAFQGSQVVLDDAALAHQITNVLRLQADDQITLLDNSGQEFEVALEHVERRAVRGRVVEQRMSRGEPSTHLTLFLALLKGERFEWALQKATELGVRAIVPIVCDHNVVEPAASRGSQKQERWQRIVREAAEQARRGRLPLLSQPLPFPEACARAVAESRAFLLWEGDGAISLRAALRQPSASLPDRQPTSLAIFSGPEGGWSDAELATTIMYNIIKVSLGPRTLRAETAPLVAAAAIFYEHGDLGSA
jgi:16S rRNA (uracil1498-N3)-methyltransferase